MVGEAARTICAGLEGMDRRVAKLWGQGGLAARQHSLAENDDKPRAADKRRTEKDIECRDVAPDRVAEGKGPDERGIFERREHRDGRSAHAFEQGELADAGVRRINVSLDTLQADRFTAITRRGRIADVLDAPNDEAVLARVRGQVAVLCRKFPVYGA